jgi:capsular polysaccharide biosynthesis protein
MTAQPGSEYFELADYVGVLRRRWLMILAFTFAGILLGAGYYYVAPRIYTATVLIQVTALPTDANALGGRTGGPVNMDNEGQIVQSATVAAIAKSQLKTPLSVTNLLKEIHVAVPPNTTFLQVSCEAGSAEQAQLCANAFGRAYLYNRRSSALALITSGIRQLGAQAAALEKNIVRLHTKLGKGGLPTGSAARGTAELQLAAEVARLSAIQGKINSVTPLEAQLSTKSTFVGQILTPAVNPTRPTSPKKKLLLPSGMAAGLVIGLVFAYLLEWRRPRIHAARDIQRRANVPMITSLADVKGGAQTTFAPPRSAAGRAYSELAQYIGAALGDGHHVLLVTVAEPDSVSGPAAANFAFALARTRGETILICADPSAMTIPRLLGPADGRGFAEVLAGIATVADVARRIADLPLLRVITPGLDAAGAVYDLRHDRVQRLMRDLSGEARYVVIDVPSPGTEADFFSLAEFADGAIVVAEAGTTSAAHFTDCMERLERMRTTVLAAVLLPGGGRSGRPREARSRGTRSAGTRSAGASPEWASSERAGSERAGSERAGSERASSERASSEWASPGRRAEYIPDEQPVSYHQLAGDEAAGPPQPVLRPVASRRTAGPAGTNGGSRHAAPSHAQSDPIRPAGTTQGRAEPPESAGLHGGWRPRAVSETWPMPRSGLTDQDEEPGPADPPIGH